ncbi:MAG: superoxide dismutase family protein [Pirellulales bacterium]
MSIRFSLALAALLVALPALTAVADEHEHEAEKHAEMPKYGICVMEPTAGNETKGVLLFVQTTDGTALKGYMTGLTPGEHGFHIHEFGDRRAADGTSAGGHYNPDGHKHGGPDDAEKHVGDLGNVTANDDGVAKVDLVIHSKLHFLLGRSLVVHADKDDLESQPSGDAGPRVAVGVIGIANPEYKPEEK